MSSPRIIRFRKVLAQREITRPVWPEGVRLQKFNPACHAFKAHSLLIKAYRNGGGTIRPYDEWWPQLRADSEYDAKLCFIAADTNDNEIAAFVQCWTSAFVKDVAVAERWRRKGLGTAMMQVVFRAFAERNAPFVDLKVEKSNPHGAERFYQYLGMEHIEG